MITRQEIRSCGGFCIFCKIFIGNEKYFQVREHKPKDGVFVYKNISVCLKCWQKYIGEKLMFEE